MASTTITTTLAYDTEIFDRQTSNVQVKQTFSDYMDNVQTKLKNNWRPPDFMENCHIRVVFKVNRDGKIISKNIVESSGNDVYDESAIVALMKSQPFEKFPESTARETITINYTFETSLIEESRMKGYYSLAKKCANSQPNKAIEYLTLALNEVGGEEDSYFLYKMRGDLKSLIGDSAGADDDYTQYKTFKARTDKKRIHALNRLASIDNSAFTYYYLAYACEMNNDYDGALSAIDNAIRLDESNFKYKNYKNSLLNKTGKTTNLAFPNKVNEVQNYKPVSVQPLIDEQKDLTAPMIVKTQRTIKEENPSYFVNIVPPPQATNQNDPMVMQMLPKKESVQNQIDSKDKFFQLGNDVQEDDDSDATSENAFID